ncbi:MAG TPA: PTS sugar transporter subunit IIA [bacterium]|nr:PTS sugar transporter subunit IIA [bacterium]HPN46120.1 PTS sugar transporter subunit IIA [bacterium]
MISKELAQLFNNNLFISNLKATNKEEVLGELLDLFIKEKIVRNRQIVLEMLHQRETLGSTGIGKGVAIPHGRTTAALNVVIAFGKSEKGIDFNAIDKQPVHLFFMIIAPPNDEENKYLPALGSLVTIIKSEKNRERLLKVTNYSELLSIISGE